MQFELFGFIDWSQLGAGEGDGVALGLGVGVGL